MSLKVTRTYCIWVDHASLFDDRQKNSLIVSWALIRDGFR